jgi:transcriptional regulator with XRE-family HTH domain
VNPSEKRLKSKLKILIRQRNLTQRQLSDMMNVTERNINDWVRGASIPRLDRAVALARALNVPLTEICEALGISTEGVPNAPIEANAGGSESASSVHKGGD